MKRIFTLAILSCLFIGSISAESQYRKKTFDLFVTGNILQGEKVIDTMKNDPSCQSIEDKEELLSYYYGLVGHLIDIKDKKHARKVLDDALSIIKPLADENPENGRLSGLMANFQGFQIALSPLKATTLARSMLQHANKAEKISPDDPDVNIWSANILFYMPNVFGGDSQLSREYYRKALRLYEENEALRSNNWMYLQLIITLGLVEEKDENYEKAHEYFSKAMELYPESPHLKNVLYPRILSELEKS